ncbi:MAG: recombination protein O N-terminal domain-containing protein [Synergistaceae bacterium]|jgi:DNA repair protein RecO (recombination protein O)|nr:recombination protein O N-terminal domain-containing protein [Synergistaceae bacterium]
MSFQSASGAVLNRRVAGEGDLLLTLFLRGSGMVFVSARGGGAGKVRFGGGTEPLMWGTFSLYEGRGGRRHLRSADTADDMLKLRSRPEALFAAVRWAKLLMRRLPPEHPSDDLLANFYWNMKLLDGGFPAAAAEWRFLWRWLKSWGLAPDLSEFSGVPEADLGLLREVAAAKAPGAFADWDALAARSRLFADASRRAEFFLAEI